MHPDFGTLLEWPAGIDYVNELTKQKSGKALSTQLHNYYKTGYTSSLPTPFKQ